MESNANEKIGSSKSLFDLNEQIKSKLTKPNLTQAIQEEVDESIEWHLKTDGTDFFQKITESKEQLIAPIKQGVVEFFRTHPVIIEFEPNIVCLLNEFKNSSRDKDLLQYMAILGLLHYEKCQDMDVDILNRWLGTNPANKKAVSQKIANLFRGGNIQHIVSLLDQCKIILKNLENSELDNIKKYISDAIISINADANHDEILKDLNILEQTMGSEFWIKSPKDFMLTSNMGNYEKKIERPILQTKIDNHQKAEDVLVFHEKITPVAVIETKGNRNENPSQNKPASEMKKNDSISAEQNRQKLDDKHLKTTEQPVEENGKTKSVSALDQKQSDIISSLVKNFSYYNDKILDYQNQIKINQSTIEKLQKELKFLKEKNNDFKVEISIYKEENEIKKKQLIALKENLKLNREKHEQGKLEWEKENSDLKSQLTESKNELKQLQESLNEAKLELDKERKVSHATHRDAINRADVHLESKIKSITQAVSPIFKEVDEFESIGELPERARMLLNICRKLKNALKTNGVNL